MSQAPSEIAPANAESPVDDGIRTVDLDVAYGSTLAVRETCLRLEPGLVTAIVGPNGCGKSTLLGALARLLRPASGTIRLDGRDIASMPTRVVATRLALLPQGVRAPGDLTVRELVAYGRYPHQSLLARPSRDDRETVAWAIRQTGLEDLAGRSVDALSGGERQRAWVAMALAQRTGILLLDEPTTYLDVRHQVDVLSLVRRLNLEAGLTVGMVLHDLNQAIAFSDRVVLMRGGSVVATGAPLDVLTPARLRDVFEVDIRIVDARDGGPPAFVPQFRVVPPPAIPPEPQESLR